MAAAATLGGTTVLQQSQACFRSGAIQPHVVGIDQGTQGAADLGIPKSIGLLPGLVLELEEIWAA
ncbi:MAG: hypothetical protein ACODUE_05170 [Synechococcus sp.]